MTTPRLRYLPLGGLGMDRGLHGQVDIIALEILVLLVPKRSTEYRGQAQHRPTHRSFFKHRTGKRGIFEHEIGKRNES